MEEANLEAAAEAAAHAKQLADAAHKQRMQQHDRVCSPADACDLAICTVPSYFACPTLLLYRYAWQWQVDVFCVCAAFILQMRQLAGLCEDQCIWARQPDLAEMLRLTHTCKCRILI